MKQYKDLFIDFDDTLYDTHGNAVIALTKKLRACGLLDYFDTIILSEDAGTNKPSQAFFDYALRQTGADKATTLMIGDNLNTDIYGAVACGIDALYFNRYPEYPLDEGQRLEVKGHIKEVTSLRDIMKTL